MRHLVPPPKDGFSKGEKLGERRVNPTMDKRIDCRKNRQRRIRERLGGSSLKERFTSTVGLETPSIDG